MANTPNPQAVNRDVPVVEAENLTNFAQQYKPQETAVTIFPEVIPLKDVDNVEAYASGSPAPAKHATYVTPEIVDRSKAMRIETYGNAAVRGAQFGEMAYRKHIGNQIEEQLAQAQEEFMFSDAELVLPSGEVPDELVQAGDRLHTMTAAYKSGKMSESNYLVKMQSVAAALKAKYGKLGYGDYVDDVIQRELGFNPANRLREHLLNKAEQAAAEARAKASETSLAQDRFEKNILYEFDDLPPEVAVDPDAYNNPDGWRYVNQHVHQRQRTKADYEVAKKAAEANSSKGTAYVDKAVGMFQQDINKFLNGAKINLENAGITVDIREYNAKLRDPKQRDQFTPDQLTEYNKSVKAYHSLMEQKLMQMLADAPVNLSVQNRTNLEKGIRQMIEVSSKVYSQPENIDAINDTLTVMGERATSALMRNADVGPDLQAAALAHDTSLIGAISSLSGEKQLIAKRVMTEAMTPTGSVSSAITGADAQVSGAVIQTAIDTVLTEDTRVDPDTKLEAARSLFRRSLDDVLRARTTTNEIMEGRDSPSGTTFTKIATEEFAKKIMDMGDTQLVQDYTRYLTRHYELYNLANLRTVQGAIDKRPMFDLKMNPQSMEVEIQPYKDAPRDDGKGSYAFAADRELEQIYHEPRTMTAVQALNRETRALRATLKALGVENPNPYIAQAWLGMGLNPEAKYQDNMLRSAYHMLQNAWADAYEKPEEPKEEEKDD